MRGPLGGELTAEGEQLPARLEYRLGGPARALPRVAGDVDLVAVDEGGEGVVRYDPALAGWLPLLAGPEPRAALARVAEAVAALHADGIIHGDLRPSLVGWRAAGTDDEPRRQRLSLLVPARMTPTPGALSRMLVLAEVEPLFAVALVAPELFEGQPVTSASDVYALAAMIHQATVGTPALGQLEGLPAVMRAALAHDPAQRPSAAALASSLRTSIGSPASGPAVDVASAPPLNLPAQRAALRADTAQISTMLLVLLVLGGAFVFFGAIWLVTTNWGALGEAGHFVLLLVLTLGAGGAGVVVERRGYTGTGTTLLLLASRLLWADAAYVLDIDDALSRSGSWALAGAGVTLVSALLLVMKRGSLYAWMTALDVAIVAGCLGDYLSTGDPLGPSLYPAVVGVAFAVLAFAASRLPSRDGASLGLPFAAFATLCTWLSAVAALIVFSDAGHELFATCWPYLLLVLPGLVAWRAPNPYRALALAAALPVVLLAPTVEALVNRDSLPYLVTTLAIGFALLGVLAATPAQDLRDLARAVLGIVNVAAASSLLLLFHGWELEGAAVLASPALGVFACWAVGCTGLIAFGYVGSGRALAKPTYRLVELAGLLQLFGVATLLSLARDPETLYPTILFVSGAVVLGAGLWTRHASLLLSAAVALLLNLSLQYFVRLHHLLPTAVLIIGFGVLLLGLGLTYERRIKRLLPALRTWS